LTEQRNIKVRLTGVAIIFFVTIFFCEMVSRYFACKDFNTPFWDPSRIIYAYYPELLSLPPKLDTSKVNILILGGSAITDTLCHISKNLEKDFGSQSKHVNIYNLAQFAHTTLDTKIKFDHCKDLGFDYVFTYDGINDTRANNCPDNVFSKDYSHIQFYSQVNIYERHPEINYFTLPFVIDYYWNEFKIKAGYKKIIPQEYVVVNWKLIGTDTTTEASTGKENIRAMREFIDKNQDKIFGSNLIKVDSAWWSEGKNVKSAQTFKNNLEHIYAAKPSQTKLILTEYAWYQPAGYTLKNFLYQKLDYAEQRWPTELYGKAENVCKGLRVHNKIIDSASIGHPDIIYFNFNDSIPHTGDYFNDICHLADSGQILLSHILAHKIIQTDKRLH
jgi:hypothetical protein